MIKVNLLKNRGGGRSSVAGQTEVTDMQFDESFDVGFEEGAGTSQKDVLVKVILMLMWAVGLYTYEWYNIDQLTTVSNGLTAQVAQLDAEIATLRPQVEEAKVLQKENEELTKKITLVKDLGKLRLREIRAIDHLQNIIPERVWFTTMNFSENRFDLVGLSASDQDLDALLDGIRSNPTFKDVLLKSAVEQKTPQGNVKSFSITSELARGS